MRSSATHGIGNLTDEDGPYVELMAGAYTDNQPDFRMASTLRNEDVQSILVSDPEDWAAKNATQSRGES